MPVPEFLEMNTNHRRSPIDGWHSTKTPRPRYRMKKKKRGRKKQKDKICKFCGGHYAKTINGVKAHKTCLWVHDRATGGKVPIMVKVATLSPRQRQAMRLFSFGLDNSEIGKLMGISPYQVGVHKTNSAHHLGVPIRALPRMAIVCRIAGVRDQLTEAEREKLKG